MTAGFIVDCSVAMTWCFIDEATETSTDLLRRLDRGGAVVPSIWFLEVTNVLAISERRGRIALAKSAEFVARVAALPIETDDEAPARALTEILPLCREHGLTAYDAVYLDLAIRRSLPLATLDDDLRRAAKKAGISLLGR